MQVAYSPADVRELVVAQFRQLGIEAKQADAPAETILIREGRYRGRSYRSEGLLAMWLNELGLVQFYDADGAMLTTINLHDRPADRRAAA